MSYDTTNVAQPLDSDETRMLISAEKVEGTDVYDMNSEKVGNVDSIMLDKYSGKVAYSVMSFGGFFGIGERYHALPWDILTYDVDLGGYKVNKTADQLKDAPHFSRGEIDTREYARNSAAAEFYGSSASQPPL